MSTMNLTLLTDFYELTMMQGYFKSQNNEKVVFDAFYRKNPCDGGYAIAAGLEQLVKYIKDLHFSDHDIRYLSGLGIFDADFLDYLADFRSRVIFMPFRKVRSFSRVNRLSRSSHRLWKHSL